VDIKRLVEDRVEYFKAIADSKRVSFELRFREFHSICGFDKDY